MEPITEEISSLNVDNRIYYTYCNTKVVSKMYTFVWCITEFFNIYKLVSHVKLNTEEERLPFNICLQVDNKKEKVTFYVKSTPAIKTMLCQAQLQSGLSTDKYYVLPCVRDGEIYSFEIDYIFMTTAGLEFTLYGNVRVIFKLHCIETILHNTIDTVALNFNDRIEIKDLRPGISTIITLKIQNTEFEVSKELLCAKSEYFKTWFDVNETTVVDIDDVSLEIAPMLKNFINNEDLSMFLQDVDICHLLALFKAAIIYSMRDLQILCIRCIKENIFIREDILEGNILLDVLLFADFYDIKDLLKFTIDFIALNSNYINNSFHLNIEQNYPTLFALLKGAKINTCEAHSVF
ncbi:uncharacterized protein LOC116846877 isoform X1 [Odontomachus brunneus]|uniref:uncharacterized protein LOC116846877 isoform X1 n=1 Tax=Odontomachus brunneus TaxID=486640 RepID=UPI0013F1AB17|nr:uncharacterized protein LOC116846877 isoform X1 [Odontomachus brunneus]